MSLFLVVLQNKTAWTSQLMLSYKKEILPLWDCLIKLPLEAGCFWGLQYFSVDMKITANPISASGIALRFLLLIYKLKKKKSFSVQIQKQIGKWVQVQSTQSTKYSIPPPKKKKKSAYTSFSQQTKPAQIAFIIAMSCMYELLYFLMLWLLSGSSNLAHTALFSWLLGI